MFSKFEISPGSNFVSANCKHEIFMCEVFVTRLTCNLVLVVLVFLAPSDHKHKMFSKFEISPGSNFVSANCKHEIFMCEVFVTRLTCNLVLVVLVFLAPSDHKHKMLCV